ncbi:hypothetical protein SCLCIDRAFT_1215429 [Scleroderma citrinum Foug A]|uniref:DEAD/DEAH-box helicase domain-containing protein n=1 Tax=Scleroderma citrinum Foug A TaxID=1036808 RepID=A0A0C3AB41_9AGAM|nr:hypothetical protein SCLCIDRAFT_1222525 [Scleroderma citrinum Foug A]KIM62092.1 hypothetical protein SCLCIDRAFT_1215429 [Scleroderma citrinum Foug A]
MDGPTAIETLRNATPETLQHLADELTDHRFPYNYIQTLNAADKIDASAPLALLHGFDTLITAGTGSGKTLCLLIPILPQPGSTSITVLPLKHLLSTQVRL